MMPLADRWNYELLEDIRQRKKEEGAGSHVRNRGHMSMISPKFDFAERT